MLGSPEHTPYDLRFRVLGIPVRVHPWFWLIMLMIGPNHDLAGSLVFMAAAFVSILIHELGHGLSSRGLGREPGGIVLYSMGGFCYFDKGWLGPWRQIVVLACGPLAGFALLGCVLSYARSAWGVPPLNALALIDVGPGVEMIPPVSLRMFQFFVYMLYINFWWGVFNLFPIWPLDGGQIAVTFLGTVRPREGVRWAHVISLLTAGGLAMWRLSESSYLSALWIGYFGYINYQVLQSMHYAHHSSYEDPGRW